MDVGNAKAPLPGTWYLSGAPYVVTFAYTDTGRSPIEPQELGLCPGQRATLGLNLQKPVELLKKS